MTDVTYSYDISIAAPVHAVFEYCRDPRRIYAGDPTHDVVETHTAAKGSGTTATIEAKAGPFDEEITLKYVDVDLDRRIVFDARPRSTLRIMRRITMTGALHSWTWTFTPEDEATRLMLVVVEHDAPLYERVLDTLTLRSGTRMFEKEITGRLARIKKAVETQAAPAR